MQATETDTAAPAADETIESVQDTPAPVGWVRRLLGLTGAPSDATASGDRLIGRQLAQPAIDDALQAAQKAAADTARSRVSVARAALAEAVKRRDALEQAVADSGDMRPGTAWAFRRPAASKAAALAAARDSVAAAAAEVAPSGGSTLAAALNDAAGAVLSEIGRALTVAHDAADVERMAEASTAPDPMEKFDTAYRSRLEVQLFDLPIATRRCEVLTAAIAMLEDDVRHAGRGATDADDIVASVVAAVAAVPLCVRCAHGSRAAKGRPPLVYIGRLQGGPSCARCAPGEQTDDGARGFVVRSTDAAAASPEWKPYVCVDDSAAAVTLDPSVTDRHGAPMTVATEIVTMPDGRKVERKRGTRDPELRGISVADADARTPRIVWPPAA